MTEIPGVRTKTLFVLTVLASLAAAPSMASAQSCRTGDCWGAVAYGVGGVWAYAVNYPNRSHAHDAALAKCAGRCTNTLTFHNTCGAYVVGPSGYGWGTGRNRDTAIGGALRECGSRSRNCALRIAACTTR